MLWGGSLQAREVPAAKQAGSSALRVDNFLRPFTQKHLLALLREHGELAAEHGFWMNSIKTHCYVRFHHAEAAAAAREALWGLVWPPQHGKSWVTLRTRWVTLRARWVTLRFGSWFGGAHGVERAHPLAR